MDMSTAADYHKDFFHGWVGAGQGLPMSLSVVRDSSVEFRNYQEDVKASGNARLAGVLLNRNSGP